MPIQFTVSPDHNAARVSSWYIFNSRLGRILGESFHLELYDDFTAMRDAVMNDRVELIYANAFDTALLVRDKGFLPVARGAHHSDETIVAVAASNPASAVTDLQPPLSVAATTAPDVEMIGRILLEPADIAQNNLNIIEQPSYVQVAKALIQGGAQAGFFLGESFEELSSLVKNQLKPVVSSRIYVVCHAMLLSPAHKSLRDALETALVAMKNNSADAKLLTELGLGSGFEAMGQEEAEFMIDLMDTLLP